MRPATPTKVEVPTPCGTATILSSKGKNLGQILYCTEIYDKNKTPVLSTGVCTVRSDPQSMCRVFSQHHLQAYGRTNWKFKPADDALVPWIVVAASHGMGCATGTGTSWPSIAKAGELCDLGDLLEENMPRVLQISQRHQNSMPVPESVRSPIFTFRPKLEIQDLVGLYIWATRELEALLLNQVTIDLFRMVWHNITLFPAPSDSLQFQLHGPCTRYRLDFWLHSLSHREA